MDKYEQLNRIGEGSYGVVFKARHLPSGQIVAIKRFIELENDSLVKKVASREIKMLKQVRHENLVNLIEVIRHKHRLYLVFEFVDHNLLEELEAHPQGLTVARVRLTSWQLLRGLAHCHTHNILHRDVKPENVLISSNDVVKLCDFGFARTSVQHPGELFTEYVATRWYRAPELLINGGKYGRAVDIWAFGSLIPEMLTAEPLFPGQSDVDQLNMIVRCLGDPRQKDASRSIGLPPLSRVSATERSHSLDSRFARIPAEILHMMKSCLQLEPQERPTSSQLLYHEFYTKDDWASQFADELKERVRSERMQDALGRQRVRKSSHAIIQPSGQKIPPLYRLGQDRTSPSHDLKRSPPFLQTISKHGKDLYLPHVKGAEGTGKTNKNKSRNSHSDSPSDKEDRDHLPSVS